MFSFDFLGLRTTPGQFAKKIRAAIQRERPELQPVYEQDDFRFKLGQSRYVNLYNVYQHYRQAPRRDRAQVLDRFIRGVLNQPEIPSTFTDARTLLMPAVRSRALLGYLSLQARLDHAERVDLAYRELGDDAILLLAVDADASLVTLPASQLVDWGISFDEALDVALDNLRARTVSPLVPSEMGGGVMMSNWNDAYDSSRILLPDLAYRSAGTGTPVVMIPTRESLLVASRHSPGAQLVMIKLAGERMVQQGRICSACMYQYVDGRLAAYEPNDQEARLALGNLQAESLCADYADQQQQLDKLHERVGKDVFVASFMLATKDGKTSSYCSWTQGVTAALLPKTDIVALVRLDGPDRHEICEVAWDLVVERAGHLMEVTSDYPPRYFVSTFPEALFDELQAKRTAG